MNDVWQGGCGMSIAKTGTPCGPASQIVGDALRVVLELQDALGALRP